MEMFHDPEFWVALVFVGVVILFYRPVMKTVGEALDGRAAKIRAQIEEARKLREEAQALLAEYQRKQRDAMAEAEKIIATARAEAVRLKADAEKDLEFALERRKQQALDRIAQTEAQAIAQVRNTAIDVALTAAQTLIQGGLDAGKKQALADKAIAELPGRLN